MKLKKKIMTSKYKILRHKTDKYMQDLLLKTIRYCQKKLKKTQINGRLKEDLNKN